MVSNDHARTACYAVSFAFRQFMLARRAALARVSVRFSFAAVVLAAFLPTSPSYAQVAFVSASGTGSACTPTQPCAYVTIALGSLGSVAQVVCIAGSAMANPGVAYTGGNQLVDIDCPQGSLSQLQFNGSAANATVRVRHLAFRNTTLGSDIIFFGNGTLILEDCVFADSTAVALDIEPNGPLNLVIKNSRISNSASGILLKPTAGGSIRAILDHLVIADNGGGGIKSDSTNGVVNLDVADGEISNNGGNGINAVAGASQNIVSIKNSIIARNGAAGVQANGVNAGVLLANTLLDQNAAGALAVVNGGNMFTYGNNQIVGNQGSNFTNTAALK